MSARPSKPPEPSAQSAPAGSPGVSRSRPARLTAAAALVLFEAVLALGYGAYLAVESIAAPTDAPEIGWSMAAFAVICTLILALVARGLALGRGWSRSPAVVVQLLLLPIGIPLIQASRYLAGVPIVLVAVLGLVLLFTAGDLRSPR